MQITRSDSFVLDRSPSAAMNDDGVVAIVWSDINPDQKDIFILIGQASSTDVVFETKSHLLCPQVTYTHAHMHPCTLAYIHKQTCI